MNKDELKGKAKDALGRAERQAGEWTDNEKLQREGLAKQAEGKVQKGVGKVKEAGQDMLRDLREKKDQDVHDRDIERKKDDQVA
jgi:uncharacterized protein YjbJ (UPF0337 family)